jgi:hypothetical protein
MIHADGDDVCEFEVPPSERECGNVRPCPWGRVLPAFMLLLVVVTGCVSAAKPRASTVGRLTPAEEAAALEYLSRHPETYEACVEWADHVTREDGILSCTRWRRATVSSR